MSASPSGATVRAHRGLIFLRGPQEDNRDRHAEFPPGSNTGGKSYGGAAWLVLVPWGSNSAKEATSCNPVFLFRHPRPLPAIGSISPFPMTSTGCSILSWVCSVFFFLLWFFWLWC